ncbi:MAG TPA: hypothetical protein VMP13_04940 [Acidimicrobiia bacterium]|nr:hypothetical protein [Acidimicrobiia bacterium]
MLRVTPSSTLRPLAVWLGIVVIAELVLLRTGTRTLIHIPGLGRFDTSIGMLSEAGRLAYYLAVVLVVAVLVYLGRSMWTSGTLAGRVLTGLVSAFLVTALLGRIGVLTASTVAWVSVMMLVAVLALTWRGVRSVPVAAFVAASVSASWSILGQGFGPGISGRAVDIAVVVAEGLLLLALVSTPLIVIGKVKTSAVVAGMAVFVLVTAGFWSGGSTLSILTLWNLGVPGWFSPIVYGLAFGGLVVALWSAMSGRQVTIAAGLLLLVAGGVGPISTYQTALALTAVALLGLAFGRTGPEPVPQVEEDETAHAAGSRDLIPLG